MLPALLPGDAGPRGAPDQPWSLAWPGLALDEEAQALPSSALKGALSPSRSVRGALGPLQLGPLRPFCWGCCPALAWAERRAAVSALRSWRLSWSPDLRCSGQWACGVGPWRPCGAAPASVCPSRSGSPAAAPSGAWEAGRAPGSPTELPFPVATRSASATDTQAPYPSGPCRAVEG